MYQETEVITLRTEVLTLTDATKNEPENATSYIGQTAGAFYITCFSFANFFEKMRLIVIRNI